MRNVFGLFFTLLILGCSSKPSKETTENIQVTHINTIKVGDMNAVEISAYCAKTKRLFTASTLFDAVLVYDISNVHQPKKVKEISITPYGGNVNSVAVSHGKLAMAIENTKRQENGTVAIFDTENLVEITTYATGALPDMVDFSSNGTYILTANEGEPNDSYEIDPKGSVTIFNTKNDSVTTVEFEVDDAQLKALKAKGMRSFGKNTNFSKDVEPEYLTISKDEKIAWVVLQENNAIAEIDIATAKINNIFPLGVKDVSLAKNAFDVSDQDGKIQFNTWAHLKAFYLPDAITHVTIKDVTYLITANEGDSRDYVGFSEEVRVSEIQLDSTVFPNAKKLQQKEQLGRLKITTTRGDIDTDGDYDELYAFGGRSFSIWETNGNLVYDSGNDIAKQTQVNPKTFNQNDTRSDDKGAEPEALATLQFHGKTLLFVGLERTSGVLLYDISNPKQPIFLEWINHKGDISPEGLFVIPANESPTGENILVVSNEISGTISLFEVK
ncbi:choice-of-anchor I family protein [Kordia jejudonensis]|uniref:choice-of-anchor I family protein n=1 Tax=Kordia jejudonensis TaxID=1348245 RepID=UPI000629C75F|nr:choice-of-anchor I family protein [Kordia jejudonensis]